MIYCVTDGVTGAVFVDHRRKTFRAFRAQDIGGDLGNFEKVLLSLLERFEGFTEAWMNRTMSEAFCGACGHYEFDYLGGRLACGACGTDYAGEYSGGLLVPSFLAGSVPEEEPTPNPEPQPEDDNEAWKR
jgi:hypothetical protein